MKTQSLRDHLHEPWHRPAVTVSSLRDGEHHRESGERVDGDVDLVSKHKGISMVAVPRPRRVLVPRSVVLASSVVVVGLVRILAVLEPRPDDGGVEADLLTRDD